MADDVAFCPTCGAQRHEGMSFCGQCGHDFGTPLMPVAPVVSARSRSWLVNNVERIVLGWIVVGGMVFVMMLANPAPAAAPGASERVGREGASPPSAGRTSPEPSPPATTTPEPIVEEDVSYATCTAARAAGAAPIYEGEPGYRPGLDRDRDGIECE